MDSILDQARAEGARLIAHYGPILDAEEKSRTAQIAELPYGTDRIVTIHGSSPMEITTLRSRQVYDIWRAGLQQTARRAFDEGLPIRIETKRPASGAVYVTRLEIVS